MICAYMASCGAATFSPGEARRPAFMPEVEDIVEPVTSSVKNAPKKEKLKGRIDSEKIEYELMRIINSERAAIGSEPLGIEENMRFAARIRAEETLSAFSHTRPNGTPYNTAFDEAGFSYTGKWHGENIVSLHFENGVFDETEAAAEIFRELKSSRGHYRNMISNDFLQSGVGISAAYNGGIVEIATVQLLSSI